MLNQLRRIFQLTQTHPDDGIVRDIYGMEVENADDFFHPQKFRGIPVISVEYIVKHRKTELDKLHKHIEFGSQRTAPDGRELFDVLFLDIIKRYVEFVHLIPASEDHHHSHPGGLLLHSLEASIESLRWAKERKVETTGFVDIDAKAKPVWNYCAWLGALLHDAGKLMHDITVNAVEVLDPKSSSKVAATDDIPSWEPAFESLIDWAKAHNVSSYSVNWMRKRVHNRHNIDTSQLLQPILRDHFAIKYLHSTPVSRNIYSELTRVISGYATSDDFLSEAIRMGDSSSTTKSLGYIYDARLGSRQISTAQRLYRSILSACADWEWNRPEAKGWVIGSDVYLRWSSAIDSIISESISIGYSLPNDVSTVLNIMENNSLTGLFDRKYLNDRIIRFTPGKFSEEDRLKIALGQEKIKWHDLVKLRGPELIFSESPMPASQPGIFFLPQEKKYFYVTKDGDISEVIVEEKSENTLPPGLPDKSIPEPDKAKQPISESNREETKPVCSTKDKLEIKIVPRDTPSQPGLTGIVFEDIQASTDAETTSSAQKENTVTDERKKILAKGKQKIRSELLSLALDSDIPLYQQNNAYFIPVEKTLHTLGLPQSKISTELDSHGELDIDPLNPNKKTHTITVDGVEVKCWKLNRSLNPSLKTPRAELNPVVRRPEKSSSLIASKSETSFFDESDSELLNHLLNTAKEGSFLAYVKESDQKHILAVEGEETIFLKIKQMAPSSWKVINRLTLLSHFKSEKINLTPQGYELSATQLANIPLYGVDHGSR
tara:strand:+ start:15452 stop:17773 length:2322 start_codon:yes stop_codon:yes gene_type:complete